MFKETQRSVLYQVISKNYLEVKRAYQKSGKSPFPSFIDREFYSFIRCGNSSHGFARFYCRECKADKLVAFSCKKRGFCPRCLSKRMSIFAAHISDKVIPDVPLRQWVISLPYELRYLLAFKSERTSLVLKIIQKEISHYYRSQIKRKKLLNPQTGSITVIQRFGSALNLNTHFHILFLDGVYIYGNKGLKFTKSKKPNDLELQIVLKKIFEKTKRMLEEEHLYCGEINYDLEKALKKMSIDYRIGLGKRAGKKIQFLHGEQTKDYENLCVQFAGFSMHARTRIKARNREKLEKMCRYLSRPPIAKERLQYAAGKVIYGLKTPFSNGARAVVFTPIEFIEKLAMLVPEPKKNLIRYHGVFAPNSKYPSKIVKESPKKGEKRNYNRSWAEMMKRVFEEEVLECSKLGRILCKGKLKLILIEEEETIKAILQSLRIEFKPSYFEPARGSPEPGYDDEFSQLV